MTKKLSRLGFESLESKRVLSTVAVLDSGMDINHKDLMDNLWINSKEIVNNNIDDDNNGYIDDIYGWNFIGNNNDVNDVYGHGTHVSGIVQSVNVSVQLLTVKILSDSGGGSTAALLNGLDYVINLKRRGEDISTMNCSWTLGTYESQVIKEKFQTLRDLGVVVVCAAGNNATNMDNTPYYPASFKLDNIVSVASVLPDGTLSGSSNYGPNTVDVAAYGTFIYSTWPGNRYLSLSGTSMAAPFISGKMSLLGGSVNDRVFALYSSVTKTSYLSDKVISGGFLNINTKPAIVSAPPVVIEANPIVVNISRARLSGVGGTVNQNVSLKIYVNDKYVATVTPRFKTDTNSYSFYKTLSRRYFVRGFNTISVRSIDTGETLSTAIVKRR